MPRLTRRSALLAGLAAVAAPGGCAGGPGGEDEAPPPLSAGPPSYAHLTPLRLNVAAIEIAEAPPDPAAALVMPPAPVRPLDAMLTMARDRLVAVGMADSARFAPEVASLTREPLGSGGERLTCRLRCRLDILSSGEGAGGPVGFVEAEARRTLTAPGPGGLARRLAAAETLVRRAMDDLNVEFEFQIRRNLRPWLIGAPAAGSAVPPSPAGEGGIEREDLPEG